MLLLKVTNVILVLFFNWLKRPSIKLRFIKRTNIPLIPKVADSNYVDAGTSFRYQSWTPPRHWIKYNSDIKKKGKYVNGHYLRV